MDNSELINEVMRKASQWLTETYDPATQAEVKKMMESEDKSQLIDSFYRDLEFGTGGLRGIMGVGTNRMNIYTVGAVTQGLANYLKINFGNLDEIKVAIGQGLNPNLTTSSARHGVTKRHVVTHIKARNSLNPLKILVGIA